MCVLEVNPYRYKVVYKHLQFDPVEGVSVHEFKKMSDPAKDSMLRGMLHWPDSMRPEKPDWWDDILKK